MKVNEIERLVDEAIADLQNASKEDLEKLNVLKGLLGISLKAKGLKLKAAELQMQYGLSMGQDVDPIELTATPVKGLNTVSPARKYRKRIK